MLLCPLSIPDIWLKKPTAKIFMYSRINTFLQVPCLLTFDTLNLEVLIDRDNHYLLRAGMFAFEFIE